MYQYLKRKKTVKQLVGDAAALYAQNLLRVLPFGLLLGVFCAMSFWHHYTNAQGDTIWTQQIIWLVYEILIVIMSSLLISGIFYIMHQSARGEKVTINETIEFILQYYRKSMIATLIYLIFLSTFFFGILFIFYLPLILFAHFSILGSFGTSAKLVWGNWWRTCIAFVFTLFALVIILQIISEIMVGLPWISFAINVLALTLFLPYFFALILVLLNDLIYRKELVDALKEFKESQE